MGASAGVFIVTYRPGQHFDRFCEIIESARRVSTKVVDLSVVGLFLLDDETVEGILEEERQNGRDLSRSFLPFPTTAVEDTMSCCVFSETLCNGWWYWGMCRAEGDRTFCYSTFLSLEGETLWGDDDPATLESAIVFGSDLKTSRRVKYPKAQKRQDIWASLGQLLAINSPSRMIVSGEPLKPFKPKKRGMIPRTRHRTTYTTMTIGQIRKNLGLAKATDDQTGRQLTAAHYRRAHLRTLRSVSKYGDRVGERVKVRGCWVGPRSTVKNGRRYTVLIES